MRNRAAGTIHAQATTPAMRQAQRQPTVSMSHWQVGTTRKMPVPMPEDVMPMAVPTRWGNQRWTRITAGTQPASATPAEVSRPKVT